MLIILLIFAHNQLLALLVPLNILFHQKKAVFLREVSLGQMGGGAQRRRGVGACHRGTGPAWRDAHWLQIGQFERQK